VDSVPGRPKIDLNKEKKMLFLKVLSGQILISLRVAPLDRPWKGHQPLQVFDFFNFDLEYLKGV
jgi:hypothetical protein